MGEDLIESSEGLSYSGVVKPPKSRSQLLCTIEWLTQCRESASHMKMSGQY